MKTSVCSVVCVLLAITSIATGCASKQGSEAHLPVPQVAERQVREFLKNYSDLLGGRDSADLVEYLSPELRQKWGPEKIHELAYGASAKGEPVIVSMIETADVIYVKWYRAKLSFDEIQNLPWVHLKAEGIHGYVIANETVEIKVTVVDQLRIKTKVQNN